MNVYEQNNKMYFDELKQLILKHPKHFSTIISHSKRYLLDWINSQLVLLDDTFKICTKCYWILNGLTDFPKCLHCGNSIIQKNICITTKHKVFCSNFCMTHSNYRKEKIKETCLNKYGVENVFQNDIFKQKIKKSCFLKFGVENPSQSNIVKHKKEQTFLQHYGVKNISQTDEYKEKYKITCLNRYGVENSFQAEEFKDKIKETCLEKYGVEYYSQTDEFNKKYKQTCLKKYGVENISQTEEYKKKFKQTCLKRYGVENPHQSDEIKNRAKCTCIERYGTEHYSQTGEYKEKYKQTCLERYGAEHPSQCPEIMRKSRRRYAFDGMQFDSSAELEFFIYMLDCGYTVVRDSGIAFRYVFNGKAHIYHPDFLIASPYGECHIIEIKGDQFFRPDGTMYCPYREKEWTDEQYAERCGLEEAKRQCMIRNNVMILKFNSEYMKYIRFQINEKYGKDYFKQFKNK